MYNLNVTFEAPVDQEGTLAKVLEILPAGAEGTLYREPVLIDVSDLTADHVGSSIRGNIGYFNEFGGEIEAVAPASSGGYIVIVEGQAHYLGVWDTVQILPPVTEGVHTPDEAVAPAVEDDEHVESFNLAPDSYDDALELAAQVESALEDYAVPASGWLARPVVEAIIGHDISDEDFRIVSGSVRMHLSNLVNSVAASVVTAHWGLYVNGQGVEDDNA